MSCLAIKYPFFILMFCLMVVVVGTATVVHMPVDLFPEIKCVCRLVTGSSA
jgi:multidrug efflux pump subunit AcrB